MRHGIALDFTQGALGGGRPAGQNLVPNVWLDLNFVEGVYKLAGADTTPAAVLDFSNDGSRTVKDSQGNNVVFPQNTLPITDAGLWLTAPTTFDLCTVKDAVAASLLPLITSGGMTLFMEFVQPGPVADQNAIFFWDSLSTFDAGFEVAMNGLSVTSFSFGNTSDYSVGPGDDSGNVAGSIVRVALAVAPGDVAFVMSVLTPSGFFNVQTGTTTFKDFSAGKIVLGSNYFGNSLASSIRRIAFAKSRRPNSELQAFVKGSAAPPFANLKFVNSISGAAASALPLLGANTHTDPLNAPSITPANQVAMANTIGLDIIRLDVSWQTIEPLVSGQYDFSHYHPTISALRAAGKRMLLMLGYGNSLHTPGAGNPPTDAAGRTAYTAAAVALANQYHGTDISIEIENEPNLPQFWNGSPDATQFASLVTAAAAGIKGVQSSVTVLSGGISAANWNAPLAYASTFIGAVTTTNIDGYGLHPYVQPDGFLVTPEFALTMDNAMFAVLTGKQKWNTESGYALSWSSGDLNLQATYVARGYVVSIRGGLKAHLHYDLANDGPNQSDDEQTFGLFDYQYNIKPSGVAFKALATLKAATVTYDVDAVPGFNLTAVTLHKASGKSIILVAEHLNMQFMRDVGAYTSVSAVDILGNPIAVTKGSGNIVKVPVSPGTSPVVLTVV